MNRSYWKRGGAALAATLLAGAIAPGSALAAKSVYYAGSTSPANAPMTMDLRNTKLVHLALQYDTDCFSYSSVLKTAALKTVKVDKRGHLSGKAVTNLVDSARIYWAGERYPDQIVEQFTGTIKARSASGTVRATVKFLDGSTCTTGAQKWALTHKTGRVFGGLTNQAMPVAMELSSSGAQLKHLHIGWVAKCSSGGFWVLPDFLTNFKLVGGKVNESFSQEYPRSAGGTLTFSYQLASVIGKARASGSLSVNISATDATGAVEYTCSAPSVKWTAES